MRLDNDNNTHNTHHRGNSFLAGQDSRTEGVWVGVGRIHLARRYRQHRPPTNHPWLGSWLLLIINECTTTPTAATLVWPGET